MVILGLILIVVGGLAIVSAVFASDLDGSKLTYLSIELSPMALFLVGVASALCVVWGFSVLKFGSKRSMAQRRERKRLTELSAKLDEVESQRRLDVDSHEERDRPTL